MACYLGTNFGHGSAAALVSSTGELLCAVEEGKLIGEKDSARFPHHSLEWIMQSYTGVESGSWGEGWKPLLRLFYKGIGTTLRYGWSDRSYWSQRMAREVQRYLKGRSHFANWTHRLGPVSFAGHHLAHAYSLLPAGLPSQSLILVSDTTGESAAVTLFYWSGRKMEALAESRFPHSIGGVFHRLAHHLGFRGRTGPGKLMALSAYGSPLWVSELRALGSVRSGQVSLNLQQYPAWHRTRAWLAFAANLPESELRREIIRCRDIHEEGLDLAASAQVWFTEMTWECIRQGREIVAKIFGVDVGHLGLAGGAALNCQANGEFMRRARSSGFDSITVSPWSNDPGTAIGAAIWKFVVKQGPASWSPCAPFLGPDIFEGACQVTSKAIELAVDRLVKQDIVALVSGRLEFGPRALGGRCLLADPRYSGMRDALNHAKGRPEFMPLAPAVLEEDYDKYFLGKGSRHMAWTVEALDLAKKVMPAAVHRSGAARVQIVEARGTPLLDRLLRVFRERTGVSALLLTSLNGTGQAVPATLPAAREVAKSLGAVGIISDKGWEALNKQDGPPSGDPAPASVA